MPRRAGERQAGTMAGEQMRTWATLDKCMHCFDASGCGESRQIRLLKITCKGGCGERMEWRLQRAPAGLCGTCPSTWACTEACPWGMSCACPLACPLTIACSACNHAHCDMGQGPSHGPCQRAGLATPFRGLQARCHAQALFMSACAMRRPWCGERPMTRCVSCCAMRRLGRHAEAGAPVDPPACS
eukprot:353017-Chlamydomonas_euryale.AAC.4